MAYLASHCDKAATKVLLDALGDQGDGRGIRAAIALVHSHAEVPDTLRVAAAALDSDESALQLLAIEALLRNEQHRSRALKAAERLLTNGEPAVGVSVVTILAEKSHTSSALSCLFKEGLGHPNATVRLHAARGVLRLSWRGDRPS